MTPLSSSPRGKRNLNSLDTWRSTTSGMWSWITQRLAAIALIPLILVHVVNPYMVAIQFVLVMTVVVHGMLGIRVLLLDIGVDIRREKALLGIVGFVGLIFIVLIGRTLF